MKNKRCPQCKKMKTTEDFYQWNKEFGIRYSTYCIDCMRFNAHLVHLRRMEEKEEKVPQQPNVYMSEEQRNNTFQIMKALGYSYNESNGIWYKLPVKNEQGEFNLFTIISGRNDIY